jgi:glutathione synthase/RimK-type ligase-like ATP-grasp enzyme
MKCLFVIEQKRGVTKVESAAVFLPALKRPLQKSDLVITQEYIPTAFDWRLGVLDRRPLFVCKYFMAPDHWQVIKRDANGRVEGRTVAVSVGEAPEVVVRIALKAADLIGSGFYGVDLKQSDGACLVMEVNDNPNVDGGNEDQVLGAALYREVMGVIKRRIGEHGLRPVYDGSPAYNESP